MLSKCSVTLAFLGLLLFSCTNQVKSPWEKSDSATATAENLPLAKLTHAYWNDLTIKEKKLNSCTGIFLPDFLPLNPTDWLTYKVLIPGDTIFFTTIRRTAVQKGSLVYYEHAYAGNKPEGTLVPGHEFPFISGTIYADSSLNLFWEPVGKTKEKLSLMPCQVKGGEGVVTDPAEKELWRIIYCGYDSLDTHAEQRRNTGGEELFAQNEMMNQAAIAATMDSIAAVMATSVAEAEAIEKNVIRIKIMDISTPDKPITCSLWFKRGVGLVKLSEEKSGISIELIEY